MAKQNVLQEVQERMQTMQAKKVEDLATIYERQDEAKRQIETARAAQKEASERMDVRAYEQAKNDERKAKTALEMFTKRYNMLQTQDFISEEESDRTIDALLAYEVKLAEDFKQAIIEPLKQLAKLHKDYTDEVTAVEDTIETWTRDIHKNFNTRGASSRIDEATGERTYRADRPVPVHAVRYTGSYEATQLGEYLKKANVIYKG